MHCSNGRVGHTGTVEVRLVRADELVEVPPGFDGMVPGNPPWIPKDVLGIDQQVALSLRCPKCKRRGLTYNAFHAFSPRRYRVLLTCPGRDGHTCTHAEEM